MNYGIQILRALACVMIFLCHTNDYLHVTRQLGLGEFGVCIFIMLSGFLKTAYSPKKAVGRKPEPIICNLQRRFRKIYPLHILMTIIAVPLVLLEVQEGSRSVINSILSFVLNVFMVQSLVPVESYYFSYNNLSWYLTIVLIYVVFGGFLMNLVERLKNKAGAKAAIAIFILIDVVWTLAFTYVPNNRWLVYINPVFRCVDYCVGLAAGHYFRESKERINLRILAVVTALFSAIGITVSVLTTDTGYAVWMFVAGFAPASVLLVILFASLGERNIFGVRNLLVRLGGISLEFFLIHQLVFRYSAKLCIKTGIYNAVVSNLLYGVTATLCVWTVSIGLAFIWRMCTKQWYNISHE